MFQSATQCQSTVQGENKWKIIFSAFILCVFQSKCNSYIICSSHLKLNLTTTVCCQGHHCIPGSSASQVAEHFINFKFFMNVPIFFLHFHKIIVVYSCHSGIILHQDVLTDHPGISSLVLSVRTGTSFFQTQVSAQHHRVGDIGVLKIGLDFKI